MSHQEPHFTPNGGCFCIRSCCNNGDLCTCTECSGACGCDHPDDLVAARAEPAKRAKDLLEVRVSVTYYRYWSGRGYRWRGPDLTDEQVDQWLKDNPQPEGN